VVVDALLGTGIQGELKEPFARAAGMINACGRPVLAVDIPTGVSADTGAVTADAVRAALTVTFIGRKLGLYTGPGAAHSGTVVFDDLGVPRSVYRRVSGCPWLHYAELPDEYRLNRRDVDVHKHALGHVVVVGGDRDMGGATIMAAEAALRTGAGMVSIVTRAEHRPAILARRPEVMVVDADDTAGRRAVLDRARVLVVGPGLGREDWGRGLLVESLARNVPTVLDADGLSNFAALELAATAPLVMTPHAGEAARLLACDSRTVQADRPAAALALARRAGGAAVLKGAGSLVAAGSGGHGEDPALLGVCAHGNPGMASAGMGDVLSGVIGGLLAQGMSVAAAAVAGTCLHSFAADRAAARSGQRSLLATDLLTPMVEILHEDERRWS
jgi:ADP-dependent NAD(P)H-hydrate dehydratase / NAD(P)H-hydrate epimerase